MHDAEPLRGDPQKALDFLRWLRPQGPWVLTSIPPEGGVTETVTFSSAETDQLTEWVRDRDGRLNLYYAVNPLLGPTTKKARKEDVAGMEFFHVDLDPRKPAKDLRGDQLRAWNDVERKRILDLLEAYSPAPSAIVDSGGGYQAFWRLEEPIDIGGDLARAVAAEAYNQQLQAVLHGDNTHNSDRIMRLPGTVNVPDEKKRKKGRVERVASVVHADANAFPLSAWPTPSPVQEKPSTGDGTPVELGEIEFLRDLSPLPAAVSDKTRTLIVWGYDPDDPAKHTSRSEVVWAVTCELVRAGCDDDMVAAVLLDPDFGVSAHVRDQTGPKGYAARQIGRAREANPPQGARLEDFHAYLPQHRYIFAPTGELWPGGSVNACLPPVPLTDASGNPLLDDDGKPKTMQPAVWLDKNRAVEQMTWCPGQPPVIADRLVGDGWVNRPGCNTFNLYRPPTPLAGNATLAGPWLDHLRRVYPSDADHIACWMAQRVQRPHEKVNHILFLGGAQGIGKDTMLEPLKAAVGAWNFTDVSPQHMFGQFNGFAKSVVLRVSEAGDLGDKDRFEFYERMKTYASAPPDVLRVNEKNLREHSIFNVCGVIITSNHKLDGIHLPADDRRHYVAWSDLTKEDFSPEYWDELWRWYDASGTGHVAAYLAALDLSGFNAKAPPPKTGAFKEIVAANSSPESSELTDALDQLGWPHAVTLDDLMQASSPEFARWLQDPRNRRRVPHKLSEAGYNNCENPDAKDGRFKIDKRSYAIYTRKGLSMRDALVAARALVDRGRRRDAPY